MPTRLISLLKAGAAMLILWHHFALYGPLSEVAAPILGRLGDWLVAYGRLAVQVFLVMGGFLAARSLLDASPPRQPRDLPALWLRRYLRLLRPYAIALLAAILAAELARTLIAHPTVPEPPGGLQVLAHLLLLHDIVGQDALSAGVWYVAIDFQLYVLLSLFVVMGRRAAFGFSAALALASLFWLNLQSGLDIWGVYFFGAYGLGVLVAMAGHRSRHAAFVLALAAVLLLALWLEWRSRIAVAACVALLLALAHGRHLPDWLAPGWIEWLARNSYAIFLLHYPVLLLVGSIVHRLAPTSAWASLGGLILACGLTLLLAHVLHRRVERRTTAPGP